jgi:hypothetical protein
MSDLVVKYVRGQFTPPNVDNIYHIAPTQNLETKEFGIRDKVFTQYIVQKIKDAASAAISRTGEATGNRSLGRNLQFGTEVLGDAGTLLMGFAQGGKLGLGMAGGAIAFKEGLDVYDISLERRKDAIEANEIARRAGFVAVDKRSEKR